MKLYLIFGDTMPLTETMISVAEDNGFTLLRQVGGCFTLNSLTMMFTGKLPCDLLDGGIGAKTWREYWNHWTGMVKFPWANELITSQFIDKGWRVHIHNFHNFKNFMDSNPYYKCSSTFPLPVTTEISKDFILKKSEFMNECYDDEIRYIHEIQGHKPKHNSMYFMCWDQFHYDLISFDTPNGKMEGPEPENRFKELISQFDFSEPDAMFWVFTDHGDWSIHDLHKGFPDPHHYLTWACVKDNIHPPININSRFISICDFYPTIVNKFGLKGNDSHGNKSISELQDRDRLYFVGDGREHIDNLHSTSAVACKFIDWVNDKPRSVLQVGYHKPVDKFVGLRTDLDEFGSPLGMTNVEVDKELKDAIISRFKWVSGGRV